MATLGLESYLMLSIVAFMNCDDSM